MFCFCLVVSFSVLNSLKLSILFRIIMASCNELIYKHENLPYECYNVLRDLRQKKEFCDVTLNLENGAIHAHKVVLAACIPYFRSLFGSNETADGQKEVSLTGVNPAALEALIDFAYTSELKITSANVEMLLSAACHLEVDQAKEVCARFLITGITPSHAINVRDLGVRLSCVDIVNKVDEYIKENFDEVSRSTEFLGVPLWFLEDVIRSDDLQVSSEEIVFEAVIGWVKAKLDERIASLPKLLSCIRMPFLKLYYLKYVIASDEVIKGSLQCRDILDDARDYHLFPEKRHDAETIWKFECAPRQFKRIDKDKSNLCSLSGDKSLSSKLLTFGTLASAVQKSVSAEEIFTKAKIPPALSNGMFCPGIKLGQFNFTGTTQSPRISSPAFSAGNEVQKVLTPSSYRRMRIAVRKPGIFHKKA